MEETWRKVRKTTIKRVKTVHELFMKQRGWCVRENIERRLGENVILRARQVDGGVRPYQRGVRAGPVEISRRGKSINI